MRSRLLRRANIVRRLSFSRGARVDHLSEYIVSLFAPEDELLGALREEADRTGSAADIDLA